MSGTFKGNNSFCSHDVNKTVVWYADKWFLKRNLSCWGHMMSMQYDAQTNRYAEVQLTRIPLGRAGRKQQQQLTGPHVTEIWGADQIVHLQLNIHVLSLLLQVA